MSKRPECVESGRSLLRKIASWLAELGVQTQAIHEDIAQSNKDGQISHRLRLVISPTSDNLRHLWGKISYEYNSERRALAALAVQYLKLKGRVITLRQRAIHEARQLVKQGVSAHAVYEQLEQPYVNRRFIERSLYEERRTPPRIGSRFPRFRDYCRSMTGGLSADGMVWDRIAAIETDRKSV